MHTQTGPKVRSMLAVVVLIGLCGCTSTYSSLNECERGEAAYRGGVVGFLAGSALSPSGRRVVRENGRTVTKQGDNGGSLAMMGIGTLLGRGAGVLVHEATADDKSPDDRQPYEGDWLGRCRPAD